MGIDSLDLIVIFVLLFLFWGIYGCNDSARFRFLYHKNLSNGFELSKGYQCKENLFQGS